MWKFIYSNIFHKIDQKFIKLLSLIFFHILDPWKDERISSNTINISNQELNIDQTNQTFVLTFRKTGELHTSSRIPFRKSRIDITDTTNRSKNRLNGVQMASVIVKHLPVFFLLQQAVYKLLPSLNDFPCWQMFNRVKTDVNCVNLRTNLTR